MEQTDQLIGEILLEKLPKTILGALRVMASLSYPVGDRHSFIVQIETQLKTPQLSLPSEKVEALNLVRRLFTPLDFPISTPVSGLEKIFEHFSDPIWDDFEPDLDVPDPGDFTEQPQFDACSTLRSMFIGRCGGRACELYRRLIENDVHPVPAFYVARTEGQRCMNAGGFLYPSTRSLHPFDLYDHSDLVLHWFRRRRHLR